MYIHQISRATASLIAQDLILRTEGLLLVNVTLDAFYHPSLEAVGFSKVAGNFWPRQSRLPKLVRPPGPTGVQP